MQKFKVTATELKHQTPLQNRDNLDEEYVLEGEPVEEMQPICLPPCTIDHDSHPQLIEEIEWVCCCGTDKCRIKDKLNELIRAHNART